MRFLANENLPLDAITALREKAHDEGRGLNAHKNILCIKQDMVKCSHIGGVLCIR